MSLSHVLLTSLLEKPSTGIDLARRFDRSMGFFWQATHQQIYRELAIMQKNGWIIPALAKHSDSRKKTYQVSDLGQKILLQWMQTHTPPHKVRNELMVKLRAEAQLGGNLILEELIQHQQLHLQQLRIYQKIAEKDQQKNADTSTDVRTHIIQQQILNLGIRFEQVWTQWLEQTQNILEQQNKNES
ncbi:PadR family transcriptional regulator [Acinetobacter qingfengensis]|uniref:PadR family transcriptional regulator n=1 Tax=Acinetobacter qingfengensis TaxID=1262585 RepID=A0A1E7R932_9GAMM|nr:PadR family transcriptional regulator [Acinetobacter qingfengensis]KAA8735408.1 PadR family transcriptional regulator [Acinetobacter qingfengensis]OEY95767.1 PadR family transcriptional regulator [Acinetobacter qingfengensis]